MIRVTDSTDAREQRELEQVRADAEAFALAEHARVCRGGWVGEDDDGRPAPCLRCRPRLLHVPCRTCAVTYEACAHQQAARRGACCDHCDHARRGPSGATA